MEKAFLELGVNETQFYEVGSDNKLPRHFLKQIVVECFFRKLSSSNGSFSMRLPGKEMKATYHTKGLHTNIFVSGTELFDVLESLMSFSNFFRENKITPYNIKVSAQIISDNPEKAFDDVSKKVRDFGKTLSAEYETKIDLKPEVSYSGDDYEATFSAPLSSAGLRRLQQWARKNGFTVESEKAPLEEKKR